MGSAPAHLPDAIRRFAEEPDAEQPEPWLPARRFVRPAYTLVLSPSPTHSCVSRVRTTAGELDGVIAEVRGILRDHGFVACGWYLGPSCRPTGLARMLAERGFVPATTAPFEPRFTVMTLTRPPPVPPPRPGIEARLVRSCDEYVAAFRAGLEASGVPELEIAKWIEAAPKGWDHASGIARMTHIALADGQIAGLGVASPGPSAILLGGGAVLEAYRGRGVYRALVASRWRAAVELGKPALTVHAGAMSRPILERCGFEVLCELDVLVDPSLSSPSAPSAPSLR
ncbi:MAG TPA: GNAT family N-acetyltransferase [Polyangia bacterium]|nr:GNAT family N-acetyltransferase [Polyangia bacterium]